MESPDIFLLVLDSLRYDYVNPDCNESSTTPNLQKLIDDGTYLQETYSTGSWTVPAHGSLFSGMLPSESGIGGEHRWFDCDESLAQGLRSQGYETIGVSTNPWITSDFGYDEGFDKLYSCFPKLPFDSRDPRKEIKKIDGESSADTYWELMKWILSDNRFNRLGNSFYSLLSNRLPYTAADELTNRAIREIERSGSPRFFFVNYMDAHEPYTEESRLDEDVTWNLDSVVASSQPDREAVSDVYATDVRFLDQAIGTFIDYLKSAGLYKDSLLVILGDHGQALGEHDYWGHGTFLYESLIKVPVIVKPPEGIRVSRSGSPMSIIDVHDAIKEVSKSGDLEALSATDRDYVVAESFGAHESTNIEWIPDDGYRAIITEDTFGIVNLGTEEVELVNPPTDEGKRGIEEIADREGLIDELTTEAGNSRVDDAVADRLEQLGYK
ncbi:sulfatase [Halomicrobium salinisoli]|uniref:sulfatase n=1 Tax=Halomicrobium salinisoli TaxID=2878391 RepID=UPI001CEFED82|nr:sulfatase [Halomicrobium salinisoli]